MPDRAVSRVCDNISIMTHRGISIFAVLLLAVGIGSATAVFSIVDAVWLAPLPMQATDRLVTVSAQNPRRNISDGPFSWAAFQAIQAAHLPQFAGLSAFANERFTITGVVDPEQIVGGRVSASFFTVLSVPMAAGRGFLPEEDTPGGPSPVVLGHGLWWRRYGGDPTVVGRTIALDGVSRLVVGVLDVELPPPFATVDIWTTHVWEVNSLTPAQITAGAGYLNAVARLGSGAQLIGAQGAIDSVHQAYAAAHPGNTDADPTASLRLTPFMRQMIGTAAQPLAVLSAAVALVVLIACANVAGLLLVRGSARQREWMVRVALGATRGRIMRQIAGEALLTATAACLLSVLLSWWILHLGANAIGDLPRGSEVSLHARSILFAMLAAVVSSLAAALVPAWRAASNASDIGRAGSRSVVRSARTGSTLVAVQVALAVILMTASVLLMRSLHHLLTVPLGYEPQGIITMRISLPAARYPGFEQMQAVTSRLLARAAIVPGITSIDATMNLPPDGSLFGPYQDASEAPRPVGERPAAQWSSITPSYFRTMHIPLLAGRSFNEQDTATTPRVVIVSRALAEHLWSGRDPIGQRLFVARLPEPSTVVGVVADVRNAGLDRPPVEQMYSPYAQRPWPSFILVARTAYDDPMPLAGALTAAIHDIDPNLAPSAVRSATAALGAASAQARFTASIMAGFGGIALAMAAAGLYGVIAYSVAQRVREIGVRVALGAGPRRILTLVTGQALRLSLVGIAAGLVGTLLLDRALSALLYDTPPHDPLVLASIALLFLAVGAIASAVPAWRALRIDPLVALREE
jgi:putative ABC transport system permease protein